MIRDYTQGDERGLKFNDFSNPNIIPEVFGDATYLKKTVEDKGTVKIIACWKEYAPESYATFLLMAENVSMSHCKELKHLLNDVIMMLRPKRVLTYSHDCDVLNRWHEFLGFKTEDMNSVFIDGKKFNKWVMEWA